MKYLFLFIFTIVSLTQLQAQVRLLPTDIEGKDMKLNYDDYTPDDIAESSVSGSLVYSVNEYNYPDLITVQEDNKEDKVKILYRKVN